MAMDPRWRVRVSWDGSGKFTDPLDDITPDIISPLSFKAGMRSMEQMGDEAELSVTLDNAARKYSREYAGGPLYGSIKPFRPIVVHYEPVTTGLQVDYYEDSDLTEFVLTDTANNVDMSTATASEVPDPAIVPPYWSQVFTGRITPPVSGAITFYVTFTGIARLYVDDTLIMENWPSPAYSTATTKTATAITLTAGQQYLIRLENYQGNYAKRCLLEWQATGLPRATVPQSAFTPPPAVLWQGVTSSIRPDPGLYGPRTAELYATGLKTTLDLFNIATQLEGYTDVGTGQAIRDILEIVFGADVDVSGINDGLYTLPFLGDSFQSSVGERVNAWDVLREIVAHESGKFFHDRGRWYFWPFDSYPTSTATPDMTIDNRAVWMEYVDTLDDVVNTVNISATPRILISDPSAGFDNDRVKVYDQQTDDPPLEWPYNEWKTHRLYYRDIEQGDAPCMAASAALWSEVYNHDEVVNPAGSIDGSQTDRGRYLEITRKNGIYATYRVVSGYIIGFPYRPGDPVEDVITDDTSIATYGPREATIDLVCDVDLVRARSLAAVLLHDWADPDPRVAAVEIITEANGTANSDQITGGIGNTIRLIDDQLGHDRKYMIVGAEHRIDFEDNTHRTTWQLEPLPAARFFTIGDSELAGDDLLLY